MTDSLLTTEHSVDHLAIEAIQCRKEAVICRKEVVICAREEDTLVKVMHLTTTEVSFREVEVGQKISLITTSHLLPKKTLLEEILL